MKKTKKNEGFSLLELLIVIMIINILAAVAVTVYVGVREKARRSRMTAVATASESELKHWLQSSLSSKQNIREIDTNFNGKVDGEDKMNQDLFNKIPAIYGNGRNTVLGERSPWFNVPMWNSSDPPLPGTISLTQLSSNQLKVIATGKNGEIITQYLVSVE